MSIVAMQDLAAFDRLTAVLAEREMPEWQQVVHAHPDILEPDELEWLRDHGVHIEFAWFVPRGQVYVTRRAREHRP